MVKLNMGISLLCCIVAAPQHGLNKGSKETNFKILKEAILSAVVELIVALFLVLYTSSSCVMRQILALHHKAKVRSNYYYVQTDQTRPDQTISSPRTVNRDWLLCILIVLIYHIYISVSLCVIVYMLMTAWLMVS